MESTLRLFKALPVTRKVSDEVAFASPAYQSISKGTMKNGFVFAPSVMLEHDLDSMKFVNDIYGRNSEELNSAFHKSWAKVRDASIEQMVVEQLWHYLTTYGAQSFGFFDEKNIFIPAEQLDAPQLDEGLRLVVIRGLTKDELRLELSTLLHSGVALSQQTVNDAVEVAKFVGFSEVDFHGIRNKEVRTALYDHLGIAPSNPEEFLRFVVFKATGKTLLIKSPELINELKNRDNSDVEKFFANANKERLASIFYRYKPIFLALRTTPLLKRIVNRVRRLAVEHHKPMPEDYLNTVTAKISNGTTLRLREFLDALDEANTFRKVRLAYALKFRLSSPESVLYRVRNGKSWATDFEFNSDNDWVVTSALSLVLDSIAADLGSKVFGKKVFIPAGLKYALPATEKQFTGNLPSGTCIEVTDNMVVGVHWTNLPDNGAKDAWHRGIDLDLSLTNATGKIGWDGAYRDNQNGVLFSGDITNAPLPNGATEVFHVNASARGSWLLNLNYYNYRPDTEVPFKIVVGQDSQRNIGRQYMIDPNKLVALSNSSIDVKQKTLGVIQADDNGTRFYFAESGFGSGISSRHTDATEHARKFLLGYYTDAIYLNDVLKMAGAEIVQSPDGADIDLSWESIDKTTIIDLLTPQPELATV